MDLYSKGWLNYALLPFSYVFFLLAWLRRTFYQLGFLAKCRFNVPVVVVGNITVGGSGKTPIVIALAKYFQKQGKKVGIVSRGYGGSHQKGSLLVDEQVLVGQSGDEPALISLETQLPVMVNTDRAQAVRDLIMSFNVDLVISDDGLQHYRMDRTVEIVVVDGQRRFGNGFFLPAGPLREPVSRLKSVDFVINNGANAANEITSNLKPLMFINIKTGEQKPLDFFDQKRCHAIAGIGFPQRFFQTLNALGVLPITHEFKDHHPFVESDFEFDDNHPIIMTAKDCVKCREFATDTMWYLQVEAELSDKFLKELAQKL